MDRIGQYVQNEFIFLTTENRQCKLYLDILGIKLDECMTFVRSQTG